MWYRFSKIIEKEETENPNYYYVRRLKDFVPYEEAKKWAIENNITNASQWRQATRPENIPSKPSEVYLGKGWKGWTAFLTPEAQYVSYEKAKQWAERNKITSQDQWRTTPRPLNIPRHPERVYAEQWKGWLEFGTPQTTQNIQPTDKRSIDKFDLKTLKEIAQFENINTKADWVDFALKNNLPAHLTRHDGWIGWYDFFDKTKKTMPYEEAKALAKQLGLTSGKDWALAYKAGKLPENAPGSPRNAYLSVWEGYDQFFDRKERKYAPLREVKIWAKQNQIRSEREWKTIYKPYNYPENPEVVYANRGWKGWNDFLFSNYDLSLDDFRKWIIKNNIRDIEGYNIARPSNFPVDPRTYYQNWPGWPSITKLTFEEAKDYLKKIGIDTPAKFMEFTKSPKYPSFLPKNLNFYEEFTTLSDMLGYVPEQIARMNYMSYDQAKQWLKENNITNFYQWSNARLPKEFPNKPDQYYKNQGWVSWPEFFN